MAPRGASFGMAALNGRLAVAIIILLLPLFSDCIARDLLVESSPCRQPSVMRSHIIDVGSSQAAGALYLGTVNGSHPEKCGDVCCSDPRCNVAVFHDGFSNATAANDKDSKCYLFDCKNPSVCKFAAHHSYTAVIVLRAPTQEEATTKASTAAEQRKVAVPFLHGCQHGQDKCEGINTQCSTSGICMCADGYHHKNGVCREKCDPLTSYECINDDPKYAGPDCVPVYDVCDGVLECADGSDEIDCPATKHPQSLKDTRQPSLAEAVDRLPAHDTDVMVNKESASRRKPDNRVLAGANAPLIGQHLSRGTVASEAGDGAGAPAELHDPRGRNGESKQVESDAPDDMSYVADGAARRERPAVVYTHEERSKSDAAARGRGGVYDQSPSSARYGKTWPLAADSFAARSHGLLPSRMTGRLQPATDDAAASVEAGYLFPRKSVKQLLRGHDGLYPLEEARPAFSWESTNDASREQDLYDYRDWSLDSGRYSDRARGGQPLSGGAHSYDYGQLGLAAEWLPNHQRKTGSHGYPPPVQEDTSSSLQNAYKGLTVLPEKPHASTAVVSSGGIAQSTSQEHLTETERTTEERASTTPTFSSHSVSSSRAQPTTHSAAGEDRPAIALIPADASLHTSAVVTLVLGTLLTALLGACALRRCIASSSRGGLVHKVKAMGWATKGDADYLINGMYL